MIDCALSVDCRIMSTIIYQSNWKTGPAFVQLNSGEERLSRVGPRHGIVSLDVDKFYEGASKV